MGTDSPVSRRIFQIKISDYQLHKAPKEWLEEIIYETPDETCKNCQITRFEHMNEFAHTMQGDFQMDCPLGKQIEDLFMKIALIK